MLDGIRFVVVLGVLLVVPRLADACSCLSASPCRQYRNAEAVFAGDVVSVAEPGPGNGPKVVRLRVARAYKGPTTVGEVVSVEMPSGSSAACSLDVSVGDRYVIHGGIEGGRITTNLCRGSHLLEDGRPWPSLPPQGGVVSGWLARDSSIGPNTPLPNVIVWIATPGRRIAAKTDVTGAFRLTGVPPGTWTVEFGLGPTEPADTKIELDAADDCAEIYAAPRPRGE